MATVAIGAIGRGNNYSDVKYKFSDGQIIASPYAIDALIQRKQLKFDKIIVLLTEGARGETWDVMKTFLQGHSNAGEICDVSIKDGRNQDELWAIFDTIVENVEDGDDLYIDITNGLRHLPVLLLIACSYLRAARKVTIKSISYGALDLGGKNEKWVITECDVIELLPYVALFDWSSGVEAFRRSGDAGILAKLLRESASSLVEPETQQSLKDVADKLDKVTLALELARPEEASAEIKVLTSKLEAVQESSKQYAKPFGLLNDMIKRDFTKITELSAKGLSSIENKLQTQRNLIDWYEGKNRLALAILLGREWLVSKYIVKQGKIREIDNRKAREDMASELWSNTDNAPELSEAFRSVVTARNDIAHVGQTYTRKNAKDLQSEIKRILKSLKNIK